MLSSTLRCADGTRPDACARRAGRHAFGWRRTLRDWSVMVIFENRPTEAERGWIAMLFRTGVSKVSEAVPVFGGELSEILRRFWQKFEEVV